MDEFSVNCALFPLDENRCPVKLLKGVNFPLHYFAFGGSIDGIRGFIYVGVDINCRDKQGRTPLHEACCNNQKYFIKDSHKLEVVKLLVSNGADPCALDNLEETPLHCVARHRIDRDIASFLVLQVSQARAVRFELVRLVNTKINKF